MLFSAQEVIEGGGGGGGGGGGETAFALTVSFICIWFILIRQSLCFELVVKEEHIAVIYISPLKDERKKLITRESRLKEKAGLCLHCGDGR